MRERIYLASLYEERPLMKTYAEALKDEGHEIVARWVYGGEEGLTREQIAHLDFEDVQRCTLLILFTKPRGERYSGGGRHVEFGLAYAWGKKVFIVGDKEHIFCHLPHVAQFSRVQEVIEAIRP